MSDHFHCVLRTRPDVVAEWSDEEIAPRWWNLFPRRRNEDGTAADPTKEDLQAIHRDKEILKVKKFQQRQQLKKSVPLGQPSVGRHGQISTVT